MLAFFSSLGLILHIVTNFNWKNIHCNDVIFYGFIICDFRPDFNLKLQILLTIGHFEDPNLTLQCFSQVLKKIHFYLDVPNPKSNIFPILWKTIPLNLTPIFTAESQNFRFRGFTLYSHEIEIGLNSLHQTYLWSVHRFMGTSLLPQN